MIHVGASRKERVFSIRKPSLSSLDEVLGDQRDKEFSYPDVGATRASLPDGYRHVGQVIELGHGERTFVQAMEALRGWQAHLGAGVVLRPPNPGVREHLAVVLAVPLVPIYARVACRVVYVVEEPTRFGFAYGTLPHHVIEGEEAFVIERDDAETVRFRISAFMRPRGAVMRAVAPLVQLLDEHLVRRYLRALQRHVAEQG